MFSEFKDYVVKNNVGINDAAFLKLKEYWDFLLLHNKALHLFSRKEPEEELKRQFYDVVLLNVFLPEYKELIDAGSGAGFVGIILAILNSKKSYILVERSKKKSNFLKMMALKLNLLNVKIFEGDIGSFNSEVDVVVSKASCMVDLLERRLGYLVKKGGILAHYTNTPMPFPYKNYLFYNPFRKNNSYISVIERVM